jgi:hypothetical protein
MPFEDGRIRRGREGGRECLLVAKLFGSTNVSISSPPHHASTLTSSRVPKAEAGGPSLDGGRANGTPMSLAAFDSGTCLRVEIPPGLRTEARQ